MGSPETFPVAFTMFVPLLISMALGVTRAGIEIPRDNCRWLTAPDWNTVLKCDGNEVVVGACSGGGGWGHKDCPGGTVHELHCCAVPEYYYSNCDEYTSDWGVGIDCRDHGEGLVMEGSCHSGDHHDCHGAANQIECCAGHLAGQKVGPTDQCGWQYSGHGVQLDCGRSDEVVVGRCGSGGNLDCPGSTSHGNLCCEVDVLPEF